MKILVIYGGKSGEHEISLISASSVVRALSRKNEVILAAINKDGKWFLQPESERIRILEDEKASFSVIENPENEIFIRPSGGKNAFFTKDRNLETDAVFPVLHGTYGEDGTIQGLLEMAGIAYVGCSVLSSSISMDKEKAKIVAEHQGINVVPFVCMRRSDLNDSSSYDEIIQNTVEKLGFPLFVKPCCAGSSNGASKAKNRKELSFALMEAFSWDDKVLIEKSIENAKEIECSVTGNSVAAGSDNEIEEVKAYVPGEIKPFHDFYDFDAKYNDPDGASLLIPAELSTDMIETVRSAAVKIYRILDATGLARVDFFIDNDSGELYFNEINTMPGFTSISMFPKMCEKAGLPFEELAELLVDEAVLRFKSKKNLQTSR